MLRSIFRYLRFFLLLAVVSVSCQEKYRELKLLKVTEVGSKQLADTTLVDVINSERDLNISLHYHYSEDSALQMIKSGEIDMAIIPNNTLIQSRSSRIRTISPLLPRIFMVLAKDSTKRYAGNFNLLKGSKVGVEPLDRSDSVLLNKLKEHYKGFNADLTFKVLDQNFALEDLDQLDFFLTLSHLNNQLVKDLLQKGWGLQSLGDVHLSGLGSAVDGFTMTYPQAYPFIIPNSMYQDIPKSPVLTLAVQDVLVCRNDMSATLVYDIVQTILDKRSLLTQRDSDYGLLPKEIDASGFAFPLHKGTISYMKKDEPNLFQRNAPLIGVAFSIVVFLGGTLISLSRRLQKRNKKKIYGYYQEMKDLRTRANGDEVNVPEVLFELSQIRARAIEALLQKKLDSNESFEIFMRLYDQYQGEIKDMGAQKLRPSDET